MEERRRTSRFPFAESLIARYPEIAGTIECESGGSLKRNSVVSTKAAQIAVSYATERTASIFGWRSYDPNASIVVLNDAANASGYALVCGECFAFPASHSLCRSDPQALIARTQKIEDLVSRKLLASRRGPGHETHSVKTEQSCVGPDPEIAIPCLGNGFRRSRQIAILNSPHVVAVL